MKKSTGPAENRIEHTENDPLINEPQEREDIQEQQKAQEDQGLQEQEKKQELQNEQAEQRHTRQRTAQAFDGEGNALPDDWFDEEEEGEPPVPLFQRKGIRRVLAFIFSLALVANILAFWPQVYSLAAIQFLVKSRELSQLQEIQEYKEAVVVVRAGESKGTGFNIAEDGLIITNQHVIEGGEQHIVVTFPSNEMYQAQVLVSDAQKDIAILDIEGEGLPALALEQGAGDFLGKPVYVIGNPLFFNQIANEGNVAGRLSDGGVERLMLDAPIYKGNSGSPVINQEGQVIAVVYATTKVNFDGKRIKVGLSIPIKDVQEHLHRLH